MKFFLFLGEKRIGNKILSLGVTHVHTLKTFLCSCNLVLKSYQVYRSSISITFTDYIWAEVVVASEGAVSSCFVDPG